MTPELLLLLLRLLGAGLLLGFLLVIAWLIYQDMRLMALALAEQERAHGQLRLIADGATAVTGRSDLIGAGNLATEALYPLLPVTSIGRATNNTIVLDDDYASGEHVLITRRGHLWWLEDLGSRNGTLLNDLPLKEAAVITTGDIITIGSTQLKVEL
jgi:hypothetical protein